MVSLFKKRSFTLFEMFNQNASKFTFLLYVDIDQGIHKGSMKNNSIHCTIFKITRYSPCNCLSHHNLPSRVHAYDRKVYDLVNVCILPCALMMKTKSSSSSRSTIIYIYTLFFHQSWKLMLLSMD